MTLSETYDLASERGSSIFIAATSFQIVNYVNIYLTGVYNLMNGSDYGKTIGVLENDALAYLLNAAPSRLFRADPRRAILYERGPGAAYVPDADRL